VNKKAVYIFTLAILLSLIFVVLCSGKIFTTTYYCIFLPHREWRIELPQPGQVNIELIDNQQQKILYTKTFNMDRPDYFTFKLNPFLKNGQKINEGDTIGCVKFFSDETSLLNYQVELQLAQSQLKSISTGDKEAVRKEYHKNYEYALAKLNTFEKTYNRDKELYEKALISAEEWEKTKGEYELLKLEVEKAKAQLENVNTGAKPEDIETIRKKITSIRKQLQLIESKKNEQILLAPLSGTFLIANNNNTYTIADADTIVAKFYVDDYNICNVFPGKHITIKLDKTRNKVDATIVFRSSYPTTYNGRLKYLVLAVVKNTANGIKVFSKGSAKIANKFTFRGQNHYGWFD